jgi:hypothetical protein
MYRTYAYPIDVEWRAASLERRYSRPRPSGLNRSSLEGPSSHFAPAPVYAVPYKRPIF